MVVELRGDEKEALDLVPIVTTIVLEEHQVVVGVVVVVDPGVIPLNSRGEKQRMHLRDSFLTDQLDPIYVAYNMWLVGWLVDWFGVLIGCLFVQLIGKWFSLCSMAFG